MNVTEAAIELSNRRIKTYMKSGSLPNVPMTDLSLDITQSLASIIVLYQSLLP